MGQKIKLNHICKVEGHANLELEIEGSRVKKCNLEAVEGSRFFEGLIIGRKYDDISEMVSRICGICSVGHTVVSLKATENAFGVKVTRQTEVLRELMTIGERIRSHATHLYFLCLPDYAGYSSALDMAPKYKKEIGRALEIVKVGNKLVRVIGGREMHPFTSIVGGFTKSINQEEKEDLIKSLKTILPEATKTFDLFSKLKYPSLNRDREHMSLKQIDEFPLLSGIIVSDKGFNTSPNTYASFIKENFDLYSTSKFALKDNKEFVVGALSRLNNNYKLLEGSADRLLKKSGVKIPNNNPFINIVAQAVELVHWVEQGIVLLEKTEFFEEAPVNFKPKKSRGVATIEVPRGLLYHYYEYDKSGHITKANIITPTVQNLKSMESDIRILVSQILNKKKEDIILDVEKLIRAYDPCFSCSTHFLRVKWKKT
ncbi:Ni/Fe hydrogenase subunit alpha [Candidatus Woesearchaeota archaeon]|nr:Ni/Fe hydrogenase subunit alpha [Candidatus Woesearchaeota archaeon]